VSRFFKLEGRVAVPVSASEYTEWFFKDPSGGCRTLHFDRFTSETEEIRVSTSFLLGINHCDVTGEEPILFETMIFGGPWDHHQWRYSTWEQAEAGHQEVLAQLLKAMPELRRKVQKPRNFETRYERIIKSFGKLWKS
jgi:hypothetical protein